MNQVTAGPRAGAVGAAALGAAALVVAAPFFAATSFIGDDHLFLAFARYVSNPLVAFVRDQHGGEFYRPLPMLFWWLLGRAGGGALPFALFALALHAGAAALLGVLLLTLGRPRPVAALAAALFLIAPQDLEAAYWYAASTDLLATVFTLGALIALARRRPLVSAALALLAYLSKESAVALPLLALLVLRAGSDSAPPPAWRRRALAVAPHLLLAVAVVAVRRLVLGGWGGAGDERATPAAKLLQLASGLVHVATGATVVPEWLAWALGTAALSLLVASAVRRRRSGERAALIPLAFVAVAAAPLLAAGWIVGARYFYLPAVGLAWAAAEALPRVGTTARATLACALLAIGALQAASRRVDIVSYDQRVAAARRAVAAGAGQGHHVFHIAGGVKDLDLAVKEDAGLGALADEILVLADVPASFVVLPAGGGRAVSMLLASPPLPPSGAYQFGDRRIVGLARRGDEPSLDEVVAQFPDIRFIRLRPTPGGRVVARDVTDEVRNRLD